MALVVVIHAMIGDAYHPSFPVFIQVPRLGHMDGPGTRTELVDPERHYFSSPRDPGREGTGFAVKRKDGEGNDQRDRACRG